MPNHLRENELWVGGSKRNDTKTKARQVGFHFWVLWILNSFTRSRTASQRGMGVTVFFSTSLSLACWLGHSCGRWYVGFGALDSHILCEISEAPIGSERITIIEPLPAVTYRKQWLMVHLEREVKNAGQLGKHKCFSVALSTGFNITPDSLGFSVIWLSRLLAE